jgi:hypothetical protein
MAFAIAGLSLLATANGFSLWVYTTTDSIATMNTASYFTGDAVNFLNVRDVIICMDTSTPTTSFCLVLSNDGTDVDISDGTTIAETDGD